MDINYQSVTNKSVNITNNNVCEPTEEQWEDFANVSFWIEGVVAIILSSSGFILNSAAGFIFIMASNLNSTAFNKQLACLAFFDNLYLLIGISQAIRNHFIERSYYYEYTFTQLLYPLRSISMFCSIYTTVILSMVKYNSIKNPLNHLVQARIEASASCCSEIKNIIFVTMAATGFYLPKFFEFEMTYSVYPCANETKSINSETMTNCTYFEYFISQRYLRRDKNYILWYMNVFNIIVTVIIPFVLLLYLNIIIHREMKRFRIKRFQRGTMLLANLNKDQPPTNVSANNDLQRDNNEQCKIIFSLVLMFACGHILRAILNVQELIYFDWITKELERGCDGVKLWAMFLVPLSEVMLQTNSGANFFIYYFFHKDFRAILRNQYDKTKQYIATKLHSSEDQEVENNNEVEEPFLENPTIDIFDHQARHGTEDIELNEFH